MSKPGDITSLLSRYSSGDKTALDELFTCVYDQLKRIARSKMNRERAGHTLQPTALVHEAFVRLAGNAKDVEWKSRAHFFGIAANVIRQILVDHARQRDSKKRGGKKVNLSFKEELIPDVDSSPEDILIFDQLLKDLAAFDERGARVVELRFFGGLSIEETAVVMDCSPDTVKRTWQKTRTWLREHMGGEAKKSA